MKPLFYAILLPILSCYITIQAQVTEWVVSGLTPQYEQINCLNASANGNIYAAGQIIAPFVKIDSLVGTDTVIVVTDTILSPDILLLSYAPDGNLLWQKTISGLGDDRATHLSAAPENRFFMSGVFADTLYFLGDTINSRNKFDSDAFTALINPDGSLQWIRQIGGLGDAAAAALSADTQGNAFMGFNFVGKLSLQPGDTITPQAGFTYFGIAKYSAQGQLLWSQIGSSNNAITLSALTTDAAGFTYAAGYFTGLMQFGNYIKGAFDEFDAFVAKISPEGQVIWLQTLSAVGNQTITALTTDAGGELFVGGQFNEAFEWNGNTVTPTGNVSAFVAQYSNSTGELQWLTPFGGEAITDIRSVRTDAQGNIWAGGNFYPNFFYGADTLTAQGAEDMYVCKLQPLGAVQWVQPLGGVYAETLTDIAFDADNNLYVGGAFENQSIYGSDTLTAYGLYDYLLLKISEPVVTTIQPLLPQNTTAVTLQMKVYPNPAQHQTTLVTNGFEGAAIQLTLCDLQGKIWLQDTMQQPHYLLPLYQLPPGMYLIHAATPTAQTVLKLAVW